MTTSHLDKLYRRVIASAERLAQFKSMHAPDIVLRNEQRVLQNAIRALQDVVPTSGLDAASTTGLVRAA